MTVKRFIDRYDALLLDVGRTFMFDVDRFSEKDGVPQTYHKMGGTKFIDGQVFEICSAVFNKMCEDSLIESMQDKFPSLSYYFEAIGSNFDLDEGDIALLEKVFAEHEIGTVPEPYVQLLKKMHKTHRLGIISDIWCGSEIFFRYFDNLGIMNLFEHIVFSSDIGAVKPSQVIFQDMINRFDISPSKMVYVGDSIDRDVAGAKKAGLSAVWIKSGEIRPEASQYEPDLVINDLRELFSV